MPKINVDIDNIKTLKNEAKLFCEIAHALFDSRDLFNITTDKILNGVSKKLGYSSYGGMVACNRKSRSYVPLYLSDITHFRYVASSIAQETGLSEYYLVLVASLLQLGVETIDQIKFLKAPDNCEPEPWNSLVIADMNFENSLFLDASSPSALLAARVATTLKNMQVWLPELVDFLKRELDANDKCLIVNPKNKLWSVTSALDPQFKIIGYLEIVVFDTSVNKSKRFFLAIYSDYINAEDIYELAKEDLWDLDKIIDVDIDEAIFPNEKMDPEAWLVSFQNNLISSGLDIKFYFRLDPHLTNGSLYSSSVEIKEPENIVMKFLQRNQLITIPGLQGSVFEMRQVANKPYLEAWIVPEFSHDLIELHTRIHEEKKIIIDSLSELDLIPFHYWIRNGN
ncbi:hypothetical protein [Photobacterium angustum]|uniref:hypothetical protein n=1 Tax=Photobacterium angustum TaxID=661 RepID=UPI0005E6214D|nr:hypothetical protein [Photobacterium angustum]KJF92519.1 hypothetical protein UB39_20075 [Photobacterium angustum]PSW77101.1 hypothetical protein CTN03_21020 [Photobacterium angustum]